MSLPAVSIRWLGRMDYATAFALQEELVAARLADARQPDVLLLLEHEPVYTIGRQPDQTSLRGGAHLAHPVIQTNRGGQATFHGPGQLIGYPVLDLRPRGRDLHRYLRALEELLITTLATARIAGSRRAALTGVWVGEKKIASIGVGVRRWITMHGFALNVCGDLTPFRAITPCGISGVEMTSMELESGKVVTVREVAAQIAAAFPSLVF